jgi:S-DNA-T family DNA segregation ATPase FtsK/SpoIIIE
VLFIAFSAVFLYLGISTVLLDALSVGKIGFLLGSTNVQYFGFFAYLYPFALILVTFVFYKKPKLNQQSLEYIISVILLFLALLIAQASILTNDLKGLIGHFVVETLSAFIGMVGVWIFIVSMIVISLLIMFNVRFEKLLLDIKNFFSKTLKNVEQSTQVQNQIIEQISAKDQEPKFQEKNEKLDNFPDESNIEELLNEEIATKVEVTKEDKKQIETKTKKVEILDEELPIIPRRKKDDGNDNDSVKGSGLRVQEAEEKKHEISKVVEENNKLLSQLDKGKMEAPKNYNLPPLKYLEKAPKRAKKVNEEEIDVKIEDLLDKLRRFKIEGDIVKTYTGPVVTTFEFKPAPHIKVSKILTLQDDLAMALKAKTIRIQAPIPGKDVVGIEIPNEEMQTIYLREILEDELFQNTKSPLTIALGKDIVGNPFVTDLKKLPHLLIAGTTGSGKSVGINAILLSLLYRNSPEDLKLIMIDPKILEFSMYNDIAHLITPVITQPKQAINALSNLVAEMERRYKMMSQTKTKSIETYNEKAKKEGFDKFPYIVVVIDELADLMMTSGKDVEVYIARLAQMARASGIHLIVATQRPSVDVVTGLIKANLPSRISYKVGSKIDSKVILDTQGADSLLGRGDMLFTPPGTSGVIRLHAPFCTEKEIEDIVNFIKSQQNPDYDENFLKENTPSATSSNNEVETSDFDEMYEEAKQIVLSEKKTSISYIQRRLQIGYNRAARIIEQLETMGVLSAPNSKGQRDIL